MVVSVAAVSPIGSWHLPALILSAVGVVLLHVAGNALNDYFDFRSGVDRKVEGDENRPGRVLVRGQLKPRDCLWMAAFCLAAVVPIAGYFLWRCGPGILIFGLAAAALLYSYTGRPFELKYHALGELVIFITFGPLLMLGAAYAQTLRLELSALVLSLPIGFATTAILVAGNLRDEVEDRQANISTLVNLAGSRLIRALYFALVGLFVFGLAALGAAGVAPSALLLAPLGLVLLLKPLRCIWRHQRVPDIDAQTARFEAAVLVLAAVAFAVQGPRL